MARRESIISINYNLKYKIAEDYALFYELNKRGHLFYKLPIILTKVRITSTSTTARLYEENFESIFSIKFNEIKKIIIDNSKPLAIWGAGGLGYRVKKLLEKAFDIKPVLFIDSDPTKQNWIDCINIIQPNQVELSDYKIIVASSPGKFQICDILEKQGLQFLKDYFVFL